MFIEKQERYRPADEVQFRVGKAERGLFMYVAEWKTREKRNKQTKKGTEHSKWQESKCKSWKVSFLRYCLHKDTNEDKKQEVVAEEERKWDQRKEIKSMLFLFRQGLWELWGPTEDTVHFLWVKDSVSETMNPSNTYTGARPTPQTINLSDPVWKHCSKSSVNHC